MCRRHLQRQAEPARAPDHETVGKSPLRGDLGGPDQPEMVKEPCQKHRHVLEMYAGRQALEVRERQVGKGRNHVKYPRDGGPRRLSPHHRLPLTDRLALAPQSPFETCTTRLPKFSPCSSPMRPCGAFSSPSTTSSRYLTRPSRSHPFMSCWKARIRE